MLRRDINLMAFSTHFDQGWEGTVNDRTPKASGNMENSVLSAAIFIMTSTGNQFGQKNDEVRAKFEKLLCKKEQNTVEYGTYM